MEFFTVMGKVWTEYSSLFLHGLWMTLYMGALTVLISTVSGSLMAMMHRSSWGIGRFKPLHAAAVVTGAHPGERRSPYSFISSILCCPSGFRRWISASSPA